jgi:hypothetical protein
MVFVVSKAMRKTSFIILLALLSSGSLLAQGEIDEQLRTMLRDESSFGVFPTVLVPITGMVTGGTPGTSLS